MKKVIGIIDQNGIDYDESVIINGGGGSETWTAYLSHELELRGYHVIIFNGSNQYWHFDEYGVEWVPFQFIDGRMEYQKFDYIIVTRLYEDMIDKIKSHGCCDKVILQAHDWSVGRFWMPLPNDTEWGYFKYGSEEAHELSDPILKKIVGLSKWHLDSMHEKSFIPYEMMTIIPNGFDTSKFEAVTTHEIDHHVLWSSRPERGCYFLCDEILPRVRERIPDFEVDIASYDPIQPEFMNRPNINILGKLGKEQLYTEMRKHAVWFYTSSYPETFNITSIEAVMNGNSIVLPIKDGMASTFDIFKNIGMKNKFYCQWHCKDGDNNKAIPEAVNMIVNAINYYFDPYNIMLRESMANHIKKNYSWSHVADMWINLFKEIDHYE